MKQTWHGIKRTLWVPRWWEVRCLSASLSVTCRWVATSSTKFDFSNLWPIPWITNTKCWTGTYNKRKHTTCNLAGSTSEILSSLNVGGNIKEEITGRLVNCQLKSEHTGIFLSNFRKRAIHIKVKSSNKYRFKSPLKEPLSKKNLHFRNTREQSEQSQVSPHIKKIYMTQWFDRHLTIFISIFVLEQLENRSTKLKK